MNECLDCDDDDEENHRVFSSSFIGQPAQRACAITLLREQIPEHLTVLNRYGIPAPGRCGMMAG